MRVALPFLFVAWAMGLSTGPTVQENPPDLSAWMMGYYREPDPVRVSWFLGEISRQGGWEGKRLAPTLGFVASLFRENPDRIEGWMRTTGELPVEHRIELFRAVWFSGAAGTTEILENAKGDAEEPLAAEIERFLQTTPPDIAALEIAQVGILDLLWGAFFASGDRVYLRSILGVLSWDPEEIEDSKDTTRRMIRATAVVSLKANVDQHEAVYAFCRDALSTSSHPAKRDVGEMVELGRSRWPDRKATAPEIVSVTKIWDHAPHNAFTDLVRFRGRWYCAFREGERHVHGRDGVIRVIVSDDGTRWELSGLLAEDGVDLRDPKLSVAADGRLMIVTGGSVYRDKMLVTRQPRVAFSSDGQAWTPATPVLVEGEWLWRVTWNDGRAFGVSYNSQRGDGSLILWSSADGVRYESVSTLEIPGRANETTLRFLSDGRLIAFVRREGGDGNAWIGTSQSPYAEWSWHETGHRVGGPNFLVLPDGRLFAAGRSYPDGTKTVLAEFGPSTYRPVLTLPSGGDTSYPGLVFHDGLLWMSYYSSHEGKAAIYLARIRLPRE